MRPVRIPLPRLAVVRGRGVGSLPGSPFGDFADGALTWADDFSGSLADTLNLTFGTPTIALDQPTSTAELIGFWSVPALALALVIGFVRGGR